MNDSDFQELPKLDPAWMRLHRATAQRKQLLAAGYLPLPVNGKEPPLKGWQDIAATDAIIDGWETKYAEASNTGILTRTVPTIDIDVMHADAAAAVEALAREHFEERGHILVRFGKSPKRAILLRSDEPFKKLIRKFTTPDGGAHRIEIMATGQQIVLFGMHKETKRPYRWFGAEPGDIKREELPYVREAEVAAFLDAATKALVGEFGFKFDDDNRQSKSNSHHSQPGNGTVRIRGLAYAERALAGCGKTGLFGQNFQCLEVRNMKVNECVGAKDAEFRVFLLHLHHSRQSHPVAAISLGIRTRL